MYYYSKLITAYSNEKRNDLKLFFSIDVDKVSVSNVTSSISTPKDKKEALMNSILVNYHVQKHKKTHKKSSD